MAPFKSSLSRSAGKLFGVLRQRDLSLKGFVQSLRTPPPVGAWLNDATLQATSTYTAPHTSSGGTRTYELVEIIAVGAGGGPNGGSAGQGGFTIGRFYIPTAEDLLFAVGSTGADGQPGPGAGGAGWSASVGNGGSGYSAYSVDAGLYGASGGGGLTGVFRGSTAPDITQVNALVIAGGGGGVRYNGGIGGNGGGSTADASPSPGDSPSAGGGTQVAGGAGAASAPGDSQYGQTGFALAGGDNFNANDDTHAYAGGGGGAGYWGGGGGGASSSSGGTNSSGGGGGSGYIDSADAGFRAFPTIQRNYTGMGYATGTGAGDHPLGAGKDHPQISPLGTEYGNAEQDGYLIVNYYQ